MITINFTGNINNDSLQIGDIAYFVTPSSSGGFDTATNPIFIGPITTITSNSIDVDDLNPGAQGIVGPNDFIMFAKDSSINISGLVGYYAEVHIKNNSKDKAEMYCIASEVTLSSK
tara:strand:+ start:994 stop:1341 length:348 start_codon:yes stop_codon:yes gene_type:complete